MNPILVCPFNENLLAKFKQRAIVIKTNDFNIIRYINKEVNRFNKLHAIKIQTEKPISAIAFQEDWINIPLVIYSPEFGEYKDFLSQFNQIRKLNIGFFLSSQNDFNLIGLKILSSLNISCGLDFREGHVNWDALNDLMHYAVYSRTRHAAIEPFHWIASHYEPAEYIDYNFVYFNNPSKYIYINDKEQIALTEEDLLMNNYVDEGIQSIDHLNENEKYLDHCNHRYETMLHMSECAFCPAFRVCLAKFPNLTNKNDTCKIFFSDLLNAADYSFSKRNMTEINHGSCDF